MNYTKEILRTRINNFKEFYESATLHPKIRKPNFPEDISENIVKFYIGTCEWNKKAGDLTKNDNKKIEVKCVNSSGPISFGPKEYWDELYIVDAKLFKKDIYTIHKININSKNFNPKISKTQTFKNQVFEKRRPRIRLDTLLDQISSTSENIFLDNLLTNSTVTAFPAIL
jgi:hypothetical protein